LQRRNLDPLPAAWIAASQNIVDAHHIIASRLESRPVIFGSARRQGGFLRAADPTDLIFRGLLAGRAVDGMRPAFRLLVKKISLLHHYSPFAAIPGFVILIGSSNSFSRFGGMILFAIAISRTVFPVSYDSLAIAAAAS